MPDTDHLRDFVAAFARLVERRRDEAEILAAGRPPLAGLDDAASVSIHVCGANIGAVRRSTCDPASAAANAFISGYSNATIRNLWDRSRPLVAA